MLQLTPLIGAHPFLREVVQIDGIYPPVNTLVPEVNVTLQL
jgi:hypothetical protein